MTGAAFLKVNVSFVTCLPYLLELGFFLLKPGLAAEYCLFQEVIKGHFVSLELVINNFTFIIFNVRYMHQMRYLTEKLSFR